jgi:hypothetical protein
MTSIQDEAKKLNVRGILISAVVSALSFVIALFWRDAITETIKTLAPAGDGLYYKYWIALSVTVMGGFVIYFVYKLEQFHQEKILKALDELDDIPKNHLKKLISKTKKRKYQGKNKKK